MRRFHELKVAMFFPTPEGGFHVPLSGTSPGEKGWAEAGLENTLRKNPDVFAQIVREWSHLWELYQTKHSNDACFWFTGGCGRPSTPGEGWPTDAGGKPLGSISDCKTSVGMDRTDDIKKSTFQVLKLGVEHRHALEASGWKIGIGLLGNLPAARHYAGYLSSYEEIVWARTSPGAEPETWSNLFDAVASFTSSKIRADFLTGLLSF